MYCSVEILLCFYFFFSSRRRHTRWNCDWSSDVCSSDLHGAIIGDVDLGAGLLHDFANDLAAGADDLANLVDGNREQDRKSTRLNSSHSSISYAVFCLKKKKKQHILSSSTNYINHKYNRH